MQISFQTNIGRKRKNNQDTVGIFLNQEDVSLAIVADGMGGHQAGDTASNLLVTNLGASWEQTVLSERDAVVDWLLTYIQKENTAIFQKGLNNPALFGMGTTIVAAIMLEKELILAHVGDSRAYLIRDNHISQLTEDHSLVNELVKAGEITAEMAATHPRRNVLTRSVGMPEEVEVDISFVAVSEGDKVLLCSDGLTNMLSDNDIKDIVLETTPLDDRVRTLIDEANEAGGSDNITVLLIEFAPASGEGTE